MKKIINFLKKDIIKFSPKNRKRIRICMNLLYFCIGIILFCPKYSSIDKEFKPYVEAVKYFSKGNLGHKTYRMGFSNENNKVLGRCYHINNTIEINKKHWTSLSKWSKVMLIAHEIVHCECGHGHNDETYWDGCPKSLMDSLDGGEYCNRRYQKEYIKEMQTIRCN